MRGGSLSAGKTVKFEFLGTGMTSGMPVPLYPLNKLLYMLCLWCLLMD